MQTSSILSEVAIAPGVNTPFVEEVVFGYEPERATPKH